MAQSASVNATEETTTHSAHLLPKVVDLFDAKVSTTQLTYVKETRTSLRCHGKDQPPQHERRRATCFSTAPSVRVFQAPHLTVFRANDAVTSAFIFMYVLKMTPIEAAARRVVGSGHDGIDHCLSQYTQL